MENRKDINKDESSVSQLPDELLLHIFSFLAPPDFAKARQVCKQWHCVGKDKSLTDIEEKTRLICVSFGVNKHFLANNSLKKIIESVDKNEKLAYFSANEGAVNETKLSMFCIDPISIVNWMDPSSSCKATKCIIVCKIPEKLIGKYGFLRPLKLDILNIHSITYLYASQGYNMLTNDLFENPLVEEILSQIKRFEAEAKKAKFNLSIPGIYISARKKAQALREAFNRALHHWTQAAFFSNAYSNERFLNYEGSLSSYSTTTNEILFKKTEKLKSIKTVLQEERIILSSLFRENKNTTSLAAVESKIGNKKSAQKK